MGSRRGLRLALAFAAGLLALLIIRMVVTSYTLDTDLAQERLDRATPPVGQMRAVQTFLCQRPNLCEIQVLPAVYPGPGEGTLTLRLVAESDRSVDVVRRVIAADQIEANTPIHMTFEPLANSAGQRYRLICEGSSGIRVGLWCSSTDTVREGSLMLGDEEAGGSLRLVTLCRYDPLVALRQGSAALCGSWWLIFPLAGALLLPGYAVCRGLRIVPGASVPSQVAVCVSTSLSMLPVALLWSTVAGLRWSHGAILTVVFLFCAWWASNTYREWSLHPPRWRIPSMDRPSRAVLGILICTLVLRFVQIRGLSLPAWVDSTQHALIAQLITLGGRVPSSYEPFVPVEGFIYHFGFHANLAVFHWLSNLAIPDAMLILGQVLSALCVLSVYLITERLTHHSWAGAVAAFLTGLVSYMPAYYSAWGRYTQLTGMLVLPAALVTSMDWIESPQRRLRLLALASMLQAGLFLIHARVSVFSACFVAAYVCVRVWSAYCNKEMRLNWELVLRLGLLIGAALAACAPWLVRVVGGLQQIALTSDGLRGEPSYNAISEAFLLIPRNRELMLLALLGVGWGLWRRQRGTTLVLAWVAVVALVVNPGSIGLSQTNLLNNASATISLFLPLAILGGLGLALTAERLWKFSVSAGERVGWVSAAAAFARLAATGLALVIAWKCAWGMVSFIDDSTVLASGRDRAAMEWIRVQTPTDAVFLTSARLWQLGIYVGTDGGAWIPMLAQRRTILPPLPYAYGKPDYVERISALAETVALAEGSQDQALASLLDKEGVTHIYIGSRGRELRPEWFVGDSRYRAAYSDGDVWVFEVLKKQ